MAIFLPAFLGSVRVLLSRAELRRRLVARLRDEERDAAAAADAAHDLAFEAAGDIGDDAAAFLCGFEFPLFDFQHLRAAEVAVRPAGLGLGLVRTFLILPCAARVTWR